MDIYINCATTGLENDDEVIRWTAGTMGKDGKFAVLADKLYHPTFKRDWDGVEEYNGLTAALVADKPANTKLGEDLNRFLEVTQKEHPNEKINLVTWDARFLNEAMLRTGVDMDNDVLSGRRINVVNVIDPYAVITAYENGEEWKDNPRRIGLYDGCSKHYAMTGMPPETFKKSPAEMLKATWRLHNYVESIRDIGLKQETGKKKEFTKEELNKDARLCTEAVSMRTFYTDRFMVPCPPESSKNYTYWKGNYDRINEEWMEARKACSVFKEKVRMNEVKESLPFKVENVRNYTDTENEQEGYLVTVHNDDNRTAVFVPKGDILDKALGITAEASDDIESSLDKDLLLNFGATVQLQDKTVFAGRNNGLALSEAGQYCLLLCQQSQDDITLQPAELEMALHKPWAEIQRDIERDIRSENLGDLLIVHTGKEQGIPVSVTVSPLMATRFFTERWESEKETEQVMVAQKMDASEVLVMRNANLRGMDLSGMDLSGAILDGSDLSGTNLTHSNLSGASLIGVHMDRETKVSHTNFDKAVIIGLQADGTDFHETLNMNKAVTSAKRLAVVRQASVEKTDERVK